MVEIDIHKEEEYDVICQLGHGNINKANSLVEAENMADYHDRYVHDGKFVTIYKKKR